MAFVKRFHPRKFFNLPNLCVFVNTDNRQSFSSSYNPKVRVEFLDRVLCKS